MKYSLRSLMFLAAALPPFVALFAWLKDHNPGFAWLAAGAAFWLAAINITWGRR
jgi:hypothetical protein